MIKRNISLIVKLYVNHIALAVYGLLMAIIGLFLDRKSNAGLVPYFILGALAIIIYLCIMYVNFWELGASDKIKIDGGRLEYNTLTGLAVSAVANVPTIILGILGFVSRLAPGSEFLEICRIIYHYYNGIYMSLLGSFSDFAPIYLITMLLGLIVGFVSYILGAKGYKCLFPEPKKQKDNQIR